MPNAFAVGEAESSTVAFSGITNQFCIAIAFPATKACFFLANRYALLRRQGRGCQRCETVVFCSCPFVSEAEAMTDRIAIILAAVTLALSGGCSRRAQDASPDELLEAGWSQFSLGEFRPAAESFSSAVSQIEKTDARYPIAVYGLATVWNLRTPMGDQDKSLARELYREILETTPASDVAPWSALALARMKHLVPVGEEPDYEDVRTAYLDEVVKRYPNHAAADEAMIYYLSAYVATQNPEDARHALAGARKFVAERPDSGFLSAAHTLAVLSCEVLGDRDGRLEHVVKALETMEKDPRNPFYDLAYRYWLVATTAEFEAGDFETARRFYQRMIDEYPQDIRRFGAQQALERMAALEAELRQQREGEE